MANSILTLVFGIMLVATVCNCLELSYDYLNRPERHFSPADEMYRIKVLKRVDFEDGASYEQVIEGLRALQDEMKNDKNVALWLELAKTDGHCSRELPGLFVTLYEDLRESKTLKHKQLLLDTLTHYGATKFESCAAKALEAIESAKKEKKFVEAERFFKRALNLDENVSDRDFYRKLKALSVNDADWNVGLLLSEAHDYDKSDYRNRNWVRDKYHFLFIENCDSFDAHMVQPLSIINLVNDMNSDANYFKNSDRLKKLNELRRVCMDLWRNKYEFYANLSKKISLKNRVLVPLKNKLGI